MEIIYERSEVKPGLVKLGFHSGKYNFKKWLNIYV
jgi:hypothetical protein